MKTIKIFPTPHTEIRLHLTDEMISQYKACGKSEGDGDCEHCLWNGMTLDGLPVCTLTCVEKYFQTHPQ